LEDEIERKRHHLREQVLLVVVLVFVVVVVALVVAVVVVACQRKLEDEIERKRRHLREQAAILKDKANDINKANEIISKLQNDNVAYHSEVTTTCTSGISK